VASLRALVLPHHDSISGSTGRFNWDRFSSLFFSAATIGEAGSEPGGRPHIEFQPAKDWILSVRKLRSRASVQETAYKVRIEQIGSIATAFYSHNSVTIENGKTDIRRVNACEMLYDGKRWWIAAQEVPGLAAGSSIEFHADITVYPKPFAEAPTCPSRPS